MSDLKLEYFKKKILEHLEKQAKKENALMKKALVQAEILCKAVLPIGTH